jgi:hypothetical protein
MKTINTVILTPFIFPDFDEYMRADTVQNVAMDYIL